MDTQPPPLCFSPKPLTMRIDYIQHPEFYFNDGSLVIRIQTTIFKVHSSILGRHSEIFHGMTEIPQPEDCEVIEGCPVVELHDDVEEFSDTLRAIYDSFHFDVVDSKSSLGALLTFLSGILRITTKYNMDKLRRKCIHLLEAKFPSTLDGCLALLKSNFKYEPSDIVRLLTLAGSTNIPSVLPWAYYLCTHMSVDEILKNRLLTWENKALCLAGKERLWQATINHSHSMLFKYTASPLCTTNCQGKMAMLANPSPLNIGGSFKFGMTWMLSEDLRKSPHPLEEYDGWNMWKAHVCSKCLAHLVTLHTEGRQLVWKELPTYFNLGTWEEIHKEQTS